MSGSLAAFADMPPVFATAYLVAFVEATCIEALAPLLPPGHKTVGPMWTCPMSRQPRWA